MKVIRKTYPDVLLRAVQRARAQSTVAVRALSDLTALVIHLREEVRSLIFLREELAAHGGKLDTLRRDQADFAGALATLGFRLIDTPMSQASEVRERLIDALDLVRRGSSPAGDATSCTPDLRLEAMLRDTLAVAFGVKEEWPQVFEPGRVRVERTESTDDPTLHHSIAELLAPVYLLESSDGGPPTVIRSARAVVRVHQTATQDGASNEA